MRRILCNVVVITIVLSTGCAAMMKDAPSANRRPSDPPSCSEGRGGVVLDGMLAGGWGVGSLVAVAEEEPGPALLLALIAGAHVLSAVSGHRAASRCHDARAEYAAWQRNQEQEREQRAAERRRVKLPAERTRVTRPAHAARSEQAAAPTDSAPTDSAPSLPEPSPTKLEPRSLRPRVPGDPYRDFWQEVKP